MRTPEQRRLDEAWLKAAPRATRDCMCRLGLEFQAELPPGTVRATGQRAAGGHTTYYWIPTGTDGQAKRLAWAEIDTAAAVAAFL
jgi:hypothetical protein